MNHFYEILNSKNFIPLSVFAACLVFLCYILVRKGIVSIHTKYVSTGLVERERKIIRQQMTHAYQSCTAFISKLPFIEGCSKETMRNVCELIYDEMLNYRSAKDRADSEFTKQYTQMIQNFLPS